MYDLAIVGGGPAGVSAAVYAARKMLKTVFIAAEIGGQSTDSAGIENWIGTINISGADLGKALEAHIGVYAKSGAIDMKKGERVESVAKVEGGFEVKTDAGSYQAKALLIATGSSRRKLEAPGALEFENKGITYCASCDGPVFAGQDVAVIGGGNAAFETAAQLLAYAKSVTLLNRSDAFSADEMTVKKVLEHPNMKALKNAVLKEVKGDKFVKSVLYTDATTQTDVELSVTGVFVEIGLIPATGIVKDLVALNSYNQIIVDAATQKASVEGVWAAGDCTNGLYHQNNIASGDAVKALEDLYLHLRAK